MSKENQDRNAGGDTKEQGKDLDGNEPKKQDGDSGSNERFVDMSEEDKEQKILELENLIVSKKKAKKSKKDSDDDSGDGDDKGSKKQDNASGENKYLTREEAVLLNSEDLDFDDLEVLRKVQRGEGVNSLKEAKDSDLFQAYHERKKKEKKSKEASLGASQGGSGRDDSGFKQGMSEDEHKEEFRKRMGQNQ